MLFKLTNWLKAYNKLRAGKWGHESAGGNDEKMDAGAKTSGKRK